jgi:hypothetical protein
MAAEPVVAPATTPDNTEGPRAKAVSATVQRSGRRGPAKAREKLLTGVIDINVLLSFVFGVIFLSIMLGFATGYPNPTPFQLKVFMTALSTAAAGVGAVIPGFLDVRVKGVVRAGGALGLFVVVWFSQPAIVQAVVTLEMPKQPANPVVSKFLSDLDSGDSGTSYNDLDQASRDTMVPTQALWQQLYDANVKDLGNLESRKLMGVNSITSPPGIPVGIYQQYSYIAKYSNVPGCRQEAVTVRATQDKQWRVYSYLISPVTIDCGPSVTPKSG